MATLRFRSVAEAVQVAIARGTAPEAASRRLATVAHERLAEAERHNAGILGHVPDHRTIVDGVVGASEDRVRPDGIIVHEFDAAGRQHIVDSILAELRKAAPTRSGRYRRSIMALVDGKPAGEQQLATADVVLVTATVPYARKIEGAPQIEHYRSPPQSPQAPNGVFHAVAAMMNKRFGNQATIKFTLSDVYVSGSALEAWASRTGQTRARWKAGGAHHRRARSQWLRRQPSVVITFR